MKHRQGTLSPLLSRRTFLRAGGYSIAALAATGLIEKFDLMASLAAVTPGYRALVCIFLIGGNDSNNMIVPLDSRYAQYSSLRGNLAVAQSSLLPITDATGASYGLHPLLPEIQALYNQGVVAFPLNVGTLVQPVTRAQISLGSAVLPENLQAHDSQQAEWQNGMGSSATVSTGWGGRIADLFPGAGGAPITTPVKFVLHMTGGDKLCGEPVNLTAEVLVWKNATLGEISVPTTGLLGFTRASASAAAPEQGREDVVTLANGDVVRGIIAAMSGSSAMVQTAAGNSDVPLASVGSISFAATPRSKSAKTWLPRTA